MADLRDTLTLDIAAALASVSELEQALNRAVGVVEVNVDTAAAQAEIDGLSQEMVQVALDVDTGTAEGEIDALGGVVPAQVDLDTSAAIAATEAVSEALETAASATVDLDTSAAQAEIEGLGEKLTATGSASTGAARGLDRAGSSALLAGAGFGRLGGIVGSTSGELTKLGIIGAAGFGLIQGVQALNAAVAAASDLEESVNAVRVVFGDAAQAVLEFTGDTTDAVFGATADLNQLATVLGSLLQGVGLSSADAANATERLIGLGADFASVYNDDVSVAIERISALLRGETEPIRQYGVNISAVEVQARALADGLVAAGEPLDEQSKLLATLNILFEDTALIQGDAARTAESYANQQRAIGEAFADMATGVGDDLIPVWEALQDLAFVGIAILGNFGEALGGLVTGIGRIAEIGSAPFRVIAEAIGAVGDALNEVVPDGAVENMGRADDRIRGIGGGADEARGTTESLSTAAVELSAALGTQLSPAILAASGALDTFTTTSGTLSAGIGTGLSPAIAAILDDFAGFNRGTQGLVDPVLDAVDAVGRLQGAFADARADGRITADEFGALADASFDARDALLSLAQGDFDAGIEALARTTGQSNEAIRTMLTSLGILDGTSVNIDVDGMIAALQGAEGAAFDARTEYQKFRDVVRESVDPIFAAVSAQRRFEETLQRIDEEGGRTADELFDLAAAGIDVEASLLALGEGDIRRGLELIAEQLGITTDAAFELFAANVDLASTPVSIQYEASGITAILEDIAGLTEEQIIPFTYRATNSPAGIADNTPGGGIPGGGGGFQEFGGTTVIIQNPTTGNIEAGASQAANVLTNTRQFLP